MLTGRPRGTNDILPAEAARWRGLENAILRHFLAYGYGEIRTPIFEHTELFKRGVGDTTDIVEKEMYTFTDRGDRSVTLRPEGTAPVVRAFLEGKLHSQALPARLFYVTSPMFRYDRPQAGRFRQFHQAGAEVFGAPNPEADAEVIALAAGLFTGLGLKQVEVRVNSIGCPICREGYRQKLRAYYEPHRGDVCPDCQRRFETNALRLLDCKKDAALARGAPPVSDCLCAECAGHFRQVRAALTALGIVHRVDPGIVRGLDYYTRTVFEIVPAGPGGEGAQSSLCGGGRYDGLVEACGGPAMPAVGFALGMERLLLALEAEGIDPGGEPGVDVFVAAAGPAGAGVEGEALRHAALSLAAEMRAAGLSATVDLLGRSLKAQMKYASRLPARFVAILGEEELARGTVTLRDMALGEQQEVPAGDLARLAGR